MKKFSLLLAIAAAFLCCSNVRAQYRTSDPMEEYSGIGEVYVPRHGKTGYTYYNTAPLQVCGTFARPRYGTCRNANYEGCGQGLVDAGKGLMYTGAGFALSGLATYIYGAAAYVRDDECPTMPLYPAFAMFQGIAGAVIAVVGLPLFLCGRSDMSRSGANQIVYRDDDARGGAFFLDLSLGIPDFVGVSATGGYNFNNWFFLGGGIGYRMFWGSGLIQSEGLSASAPVYAATKFSFGRQRVVPYIGLNAGYDLVWNSVYAGFDAGTRIKTLKGRRGQSWWVGCSLELSSDYEFLSIKASKSF